MRSDIVFEALQSKNRFELCHEAFKAIRLLHVSNTRIEDTANDALQRLAGTQSPEGSVGQGSASQAAVEATNA